MQELLINKEILPINMYKKILIASLLCVVVILSNDHAIAQTQTSDTKRQENQVNRMAALRTRADKEITRRVTALSEIGTRIGTLKHLTEDQKNTFSSEAREQITDLNNLKAKIDSDTDLATLQADVKSIVVSYRIFSLYLPKLRILIASDQMQIASDALSGIATKLASRIQLDKSSRSDVKVLTTALTDMQTKIADAKIQAQKASSTVLAIKPSDYPGNKTTLENAYAMLQIGKKDLVAARAQGKMITTKISY